MLKKICDRLLEVQKPARYIGEEHNIIKKRWEKTRIKFLLCYPDVYEIGMSNLGFSILYGLLNSLPDVLCERCFAPWIDMERILREEGVALFSLETRQPLSEFDIIGFSLQHELNYTNVINMLDLGGIKIWQKEREKDDPLLIAGGPSTLNPEPMAEFFDLFLIGEGEAAILELLKLYRNHWKSLTRREFLERAQKIDGFYAPSLHHIKLSAQGFFIPSVAKKIKKAIVTDLDNCFYPTRPLVPYIQIVHDRINLELMRGCPHSCYFCQARSFYYPFRIRSKKRVIALAHENYHNTGHEEICLLSLSSGNYPDIVGLITQLQDELSSYKVFLSLPSLWVARNIFPILDRLRYGKRPGLTFAPEVATPRMRAIIGKKIDEELLLEIMEYASKNGWRHAKLYYMIGLPGMENSDILAIREYVKKTLVRIPKKFFLRIGIAIFIPKPHTPLQWIGFVDDDVLSEQICLVKERLKIPGVEFNIHDPKMSKLETIISRGDRKLGTVIYHAWKMGARFDSWKECFSWNLWEKAFFTAGIDYNIYLKAHNGDREFPWDHIASGWDKDRMLKIVTKIMNEIKCK